MKPIVLPVLLFLVVNVALPSQSPQVSDSTKTLKISSSDSARQQSSQKQSATPDSSGIWTWLRKNKDEITVVVAVFGLLLTAINLYWAYLNRKTKKRVADLAKIKRKAELAAEQSAQRANEQVEQKIQFQNIDEAERRYLEGVKAEHETISLYGFQSSVKLKVRTMEAFVPLRLTGYDHKRVVVKGFPAQLAEFERTDLLSELNERQKKLKQSDVDILVSPGSLSPEELLKQAVEQRKSLLILGDPGSGKTTLLKYYLMCCLDEAGRRQLGLPRSLIPIFVPLRKVTDPAKQFSEALSAWAAPKYRDVSAGLFDTWLHQRGGLVLLDGLDEVSEVEKRKAVCEWIDNACNYYRNSCFVVTSRETGYRVSEGIELHTDHLRADVLDLNQAQQETFLKKWFAAAYKDETDLTGLDANERAQAIADKAQEVADRVLEYLARDENKSLKQMAGTPVLLQIMAILWKEYHNLPPGRSALYERCTDYLLDHRDREKDIPPLLPAEDAKIVLRPLCLWMQEREQPSDEINGRELETKIAMTLQEVNPSVKPKAFIQNLIDRAGMLQDLHDGNIGFRHKSFREFLAASHLAEQVRGNAERVTVLVENFHDSWWRETMLFALTQSKPAIYGDFVTRFLPHNHNAPNAVGLLEQITREARQKPVAPFENFVLDHGQDWQKRYNALLCLRLIASDSAKTLVKKTWEDLKRRPVPRDPKAAEGVLRLTQKAEEILIEWKLVRPAAPAAKATPVAAGAKSFRNPFELETEYILIPRGKFNYSVTKNKIEIPPLYFAKYTVTNKLYRRFIAYLTPRKSVNEALAVLPREQFAKSLLAHAANIKGFQEYLGNDASQWATKLKSGYDDDKRFNGEDQPVVGVSWFAATAYSFWLSELQGARGSSPELVEGKGQVEKMIYRLPTEQDWEWAASGGKRKYPWGNEEPDETRANYGEKVGKTTPVGSYPAGATPEGLMDMAGNVWEWMENKYTPDKERRALRGGSWNNTAEVLPCAARDYYDPDGPWVSVGFRVVAVQSSFDTLKF